MSRPELRAVRTALVKIIALIDARRMRVEQMLDETGEAATQANRTRGDMALIEVIDRRLRKLLLQRLL